MSTRAFCNFFKFIAVYNFNALVVIVSALILRALCVFQFIFNYSIPLFPSTIICQSYFTLNT